MKISHGGKGGAAFKPKERPTPMKILKNYIEDNKMRLLDLFNTLDKDKSMNITIKEFADGLQVSSKDKTLLLFIVFALCSLSKIIKTRSTRPRQNVTKSTIYFYRFCQQETGIDMNYYELYELIEGLDRNKDGEINYR